MYIPKNCVILLSATLNISLQLHLSSRFVLLSFIVMPRRRKQSRVSSRSIWLFIRHSQLTINKLFVIYFFNINLVVLLMKGGIGRGDAFFSVLDRGNCSSKKSTASRARCQNNPIQPTFRKHGLQSINKIE